MLFVEPPQLEIKVGRPAELDTVLEFFEGTEYGADAVDDVTVALTPPEPFAPTITRREIQIYLRILRRVHPEVDVSVVD